MQNTRNRSVVLNGVEYECCQNFKYFGSVIIDDNNIQEEINMRIVAGNRRYFALQKLFKSCSFTRKLLTVFCTVVRPVAPVVLKPGH